MTHQRKLAAILLCSSSLMVLPSLAFAECTVDGMSMADASNPQTGQTISCEDNLDTDGVVNRQANDVTVNIVAPAGGISVTGQAGVALGNGATIDVAGGSNRPINTSGDNAPGIDVGDNAMITVAGQVTTAGENSIAVRTGDMAMVDVSGTVRTGGGTSSGISVGGMSTINLMSGARVATGNSNSSAIEIRGDGSTVNVTTDAVVTTSSGMSNPILVRGNDSTVNVSGEVRSSSGNATAILLEGNNGTVTVSDGGFVTAQSSGSNGIESTGTGANITVERGGEVVISSGNSSAIVSGDMGTVTLAGTVTASSSQSQGVVLGDMASLTIQEMGIISTSSSESQAVLVEEGATEATIMVNRGGEIDAVGAQAIVDRGMTNTMVTVDGVIFGGSSDPVLDMGAGNDTVIINGTVEGSSASPVIDMGEGMDTLTVNSSTTLTGPDVLADLGAGSDTLNLNSGQTFQSSQFRNAETVNVNENDMMGDPNMGMGTTYQVNDDQSGQTVNAGSNSSASVGSGGSVGTLNSSGSGSSADVNNGGSADAVNSSNGGSAKVNDGGMANNVSSSGMGSQANVNNGGMAMNVDASSGGSANINDGGTSMNTSSSSGGNVTVGSGGDAGRVQSNSGGNVTVQNGGSANVDSGSGNGGSLTFESGSNANVEGQATARDQSMTIAGADFQSGSTTTVTNSRFFEGTASGDTMSVSVRRNAFSQEVAGEGTTNVNTLSAARGIDAIISAQSDGSALDSIGRLLFIGVGEGTRTFEQVSQEGAAQLATAPVFAAQQFNDLLRAGANPLSGESIYASRPETVRLAGPLSAASFRDDGNAGVWAAITFGDADIEGDNQTEFDTQSFGYAAGVEGRINLSALDEAAIGVAIGYTFTDVNSAVLSDGDVESWSFGVYGGGTKGAVRSDIALSYTQSDMENSGLVNGVAGTVTESESDAFTGRVELSWDLAGDANSGFNISPLVRISGTTISYDDFTAAGPVGTTLADGDFDQAVFGIGARAGLFGFEDRSAVKATVEVAYERVVGDRDVAFAANIANTASAFDVIQTASDQDRLHIGGTLGMEIMDMMDVGIRYDGRYGSDVTTHTASARVTYRF